MTTFAIEQYETNGRNRGVRSPGRLITRCAWVGLAAALLAGALPAVAGAADYCVAPRTGCGANDVATVTQALGLAEGTAAADRILLGATTYVAPPPYGFRYWREDSAVEIVGQGRGQTILTTTDTNGSRVLWVEGGAGTLVRDLTIQLPENAAGGLRGLSTTNTGRRIEVVEHPTQSVDNQRFGVALANGGLLEDSSVSLSTGQDTIAVNLDGNGSTVRGSVVTAATGVKAYTGGAVLRSEVTGGRTGVSTYMGATTIASSVIRFGVAGWGHGILANVVNGAAGGPTVDVDGVTIVGSGQPGRHGVMAVNGSAPALSAKVRLVNSIVRGTSTPFGAYAPAGATGQARIEASYSDYDSSGNKAEGANASIVQANVTNAGDAGFVDAAGGDHRLAPGSPLIDAGDPAAPQGLDLDGAPRVADGNGDGGARRDLGAFELQPAPPAGGGTSGGGDGGGTPPLDTRAPVVTGLRALPSVFAVARPATSSSAGMPRGTRFRYLLSEPAQVTLAIQRARSGGRSAGRCVRPTPRLRTATRCTRFRTIGTLTGSGAIGANRVRFAGRIGDRVLKPGRYRARILAVDAAGNRSAPRSVRFRIARSAG